MWDSSGSPSIATTAVLLLTAVYTVYSIAKLLKAPLASVPGPWYTKFTRLEYFISLLRGRSFSYLTELHRTYGPIVRLGPDDVSITDSGAVRTVLATHRFRKGKLYKVANDPVFHKSRKKMIAPAFSNAAMNNMEPMILDVGITKLVSVLEKKCAEGGPIDLFRLLLCMTLDVTSMVSLGGSVNMLESDDHPITSWVHGTLVLSISRHMIGDKLSRLFLPKYVRDEAGLISYSLNMIESRRKMKNPPQDVLQALVDAVDEDTGESFSSADIVTEVITLLIAGSDSTATALSWTTVFLFEHPECMKRLVAELDEAFPSIDETITHSKVIGLPYLNAVLYEVLRIYPPSSFDLPRVTPEGGATLGSHFIPGGAEVIVSPYAVSHDARNYERPSEFNPDRWLTSPEMVSEMKRIYMPFSMGPRSCLGQSLAWLELRVALASLMRKFTFELLPGQNLKPVLRFILWPIDGKVMVRASKRTS
ncbi:cytochrome P450 [Thamnocephalis sphaerospora]|uniref:Cytochrome P450 n=1 Tax=Thamnocephalis sphaerospora TaxID=78915 RepID=A0A4P9XK34_9FUNG|nr:cytochrome P450 [Thamnocephalis sphaerospora]|eukprot:RKP06115.1 cytochrome P450 [Thamnocephalis sphaerospora]